VSTVLQPKEGESLKQTIISSGKPPSKAPTQSKQSTVKDQSPSSTSKQNQDLQPILSPKGSKSFKSKSSRFMSEYQESPDFPDRESPKEELKLTA
jgi:hypothetical protein